MLRKCAQHLELESVNGKYSRENFKRGILNKVSLFYFFKFILGTRPSNFDNSNLNSLKLVIDQKRFLDSA